MEYGDQMKLVTDKAIYDLTIVKQSEFKKPYAEDDYPTMEYAWPYPPPWPPPPYDPPYPPGPPITPPIIITKVFTCGYDLCYCPGQTKCGSLNCTYPIESVSVTAFDAGDGSITGGGRKFCISATAEASGEINFRVIMVATDRGAGNQLIKTKGIYEGNISECPEDQCGGCTCGGESIGYTTQQMSCSGSQTFTVNNAKDGCTYTWSVLSGGGSMSGATYTAPATNANCASNAVIALYCDTTNLVATLAIAINCVAGGGTAVRTYTGKECQNLGYLGNCYIYQNGYLCDGSLSEGPDCVVTKQSENTYPVPYSCVGASCYSQTITFPACYSGSTTINALEAASPIDLRTGEQIAAGCCPVQLI
jgi:hypothetical protein